MRVSLIPSVARDRCWAKHARKLLCPGNPLEGRRVVSPYLKSAWYLVIASASLGVGCSINSILRTNYGMALDRSSSGVGAG